MSYFLYNQQEKAVIGIDIVIIDCLALKIAKYHLQEIACNNIGKLDLCTYCSRLGR